MSFLCIIIDDDFRLWTTRDIEHQSGAKGRFYHFIQAFWSFNESGKGDDRLSKSQRV